MGKLMRILLVASICLCVHSICLARTAFLAGMDIHRTFGHTTFEISVPAGSPADPTGVYLKSNLEFPFDTYMAGLRVGVGGTVLRGKPWSIVFSMRKNLSDPSGSMKDRDWFEIPDYDIHKTLSLTESDANLRALAVDVNTCATFFVHPDFTLAGILGYRYHDLSYDVFGVTGWQLDQFWHRVEFDELEGIEVVDYDVTYRIPYVGIAGELGDPTNFSLRGEFAFSPLVSAEDLDDHIFRNKTGRTKADGNAVIAGLKTVWVLPWGTRTKWQVDLGGELVTLSTRGDQTQTWYGDDPITPEDDETGLSMSGIDNKLTSEVYSVNAVIRCAF